MSNQRIQLAALFLAATTAVLMLRIFDPATSGVFPPCPLRELTGWYCPGCGSLRAFHQLLRGNLRHALALNPFAVLALPFLSYGMASYVTFLTWGRYLPRIFLPGIWIRALCVAIVTFGIVRNIPLYPFSVLAPGALLHLR